MFSRQNPETVNPVRKRTEQKRIPAYLGGEGVFVTTPKPITKEHILYYFTKSDNKIPI